MPLELPIISHEATGIDCCGCIIEKVTGNDAELVCNECGAVVGVVHTAILRDLLSLISGINPAPPQLLRSHAELRGALILAGKRIRKLSFGRRDDQVLPTLRRVLREARAVALPYRKT
jgi:hypothetical protein